MPHGVDFEEGGDEIVCAGGIFQVRTKEGLNERYEFGVNPDYNWLKKFNGNEFEKIFHTRDHKEFAAKIESILPQHLPFKWTWDLFFCALTWWGEGHKAGIVEGREREWQRQSKRRTPKIN